jgi:UDP-2,4-diacetamido-2,4,6-trideoxy-beta-L-altropyranose hydrolase
VDVVFRADASLLVGSGHVMRCLTLAEELGRHRVACRFICREHVGNLIHLIESRGFPVVRLAAVNHNTAEVHEPVLAHADWLGAHWSQDVAETIDSLAGTIPDWLVVDHYAIDARWETQLKPHCRRLMVIDDLADRRHQCDLLLDQNLVADYERRYNELLPEDCPQLIGPDFALLQPTYAQLHPRVPPRLGPVQRILVYFGGADTQNLTGRTVAAFLALQNSALTLDVVINPASPHADAVRSQAKDCPQIHLHEHLPTLAPLIIRADLAVGAGGATTWERLCLGLPTLVVTIAENQRATAEELHHRGLIQWLGDQAAVTIDSLKESLRVCCDERFDIESWSSRCRRIVNGDGTKFVAAWLTLSANTPLNARMATLADEALLLRWANDSLVRRNSFDSRPISAQTHRHWFYRRLRKPSDCILFIIETNEGIPVAQVRFERHGEEWEIHYSIDVFARGRRLAANVLETALQALHGTTSILSVFGRVKASNIASQRAFERLGFLRLEDPAGELVYRLDF